MDIMKTSRQDKLLTIEEVRRNNLREIANQYSSLSEFAKNIGKSLSYVSRLLSPADDKNIGSNLARELEGLLNKPEGWFDHSQKQVHSSKAISIYTIDRAILRDQPVTSMVFESAYENVFGVQLDKRTATSLYPSGTIIVCTTEIKTLSEEDLVLVETNGVVNFWFYYSKKDLVALLPLNMTDSPIHIDQPKIVAKALKSINPTFKPRVDVNEFIWK